MDIKPEAYPESHVPVHFKGPHVISASFIKLYILFTKITDLPAEPTPYVSGPHSGVIFSRCHPAGLSPSPARCKAFHRILSPSSIWLFGLCCTIYSNYLYYRI